MPFLFQMSKIGPQEMTNKDIVSQTCRRGATSSPRECNVYTTQPRPGSPHTRNPPGQPHAHTRTIPDHPHESRHTPDTDGLPPPRSSKRHGDPNAGSQRPQKPDFLNKKKNSQNPQSSSHEIECNSINEKAIRWDQNHHHERPAAPAGKRPRNTPQSDDYQTPV